MSPSTICVIVAVILFALAALGEDRFKSPVNLVAAGLFFWALASLL